MKFEKIIIPPGWQESFTKYPNGRTIFEALTSTITTVNEGIEEVNQKVNQDLLAIEQAKNTIRQEITESFNTLQLQLEGEIDDLSNDLIADFSLLQSEVLTLIDGKANAADVYTKQQVDAQLAEKVQNFKLKNEIINGDFSNGVTGWNTTPSGTVINGELVVTKYNATWTQSIQAKINDVLYISAKLYTVLLSGITGARVSLLDGTVIMLFNNPSATPTVKSSIRKLNNANPTLRTAIFSAGETVEEHYDNFIVVNLTTVFGAGNEPSKLEMDELMKVIPNQWWGGELHLTQKQFITWQLNLIRKNTNAIIALGGTII